TFAPGQTVVLNDGRVAVVRFFGQTSFQTGEWVGVELSDATGKNDGSVQGVRYFECTPLHGMFCRPAGIKQVVSGGRRKSRPASIQASLRPSGLRSPTKSPTKQAGNGSSSDSTSRTSTPTLRRPPAPSHRSTLSVGGRRLPQTPATPATPGKSLKTRASGGSAASSGRPSTQPASARPRPSAAVPGRQGSIASHADSEEEPEKPVFAPPRQQPRRGSSPAPSILSTRTVGNRQVDELEAKLRLLERRQQEERELQKSLDQAEQERDQYKTIIEKLQNKYRPLQQENVDLKKKLQEAEERNTSAENFQAEHETVLELATLDREMAEEKAEGLQAELDSLRARFEENALELEILREENEEFSKDMSPEERSSAGWIQMEKSNERLRDALIRLRDISQDKEAELKEQIGSLEGQVKELEPLKARYEETVEKLAQSENVGSELRQQLEVALESEEMIEALTERNGRLDAQIEQLKATIQELEDLRELNDELQVNYTEHEKQLQEEIDFKDSLLQDRDQTTRKQQEALDEAEYTITRYRALVGQMQSDLQDMQASKQLSETEAADLHDKSRAILDLNLQLQSSAAKTQVKAIDLELRKLEAQEASEHLDIVQLFLPEAFNAGESVLALLRFRRISFKANLIRGMLKDRAVPNEHVFSACAATDRLTYVAAMADRFIGSIKSCSVDAFLSYREALYELEPVERALNSHVDSLRRDELKERAMAEDLQRSIAVMRHLASLHIGENITTYADDLIARTLYIQSQLESAATSLTLIKDLVQKSLPDGADSLITQYESSTSQSRNAKVLAGKLHRHLIDLRLHNQTLDQSISPSLTQIEDSISQSMELITSNGEAILSLLTDEPQSITISDLPSSLPSFHDPITILSTLTQGEITTLPPTTPPWVLMAEHLSPTIPDSEPEDLSTQLTQTRTSLREASLLLTSKESELEESAVKIEMLEARLNAAIRKTSRIADLENQLHDAAKKEAELTREIEKAKERVIEKIEQ
ncbi:hypothetical protein K470DRAFT_193058, partial [Piedraia hortae CBS 480.64]